MEYNPLSTLTDNAPIEFLIASGGDEYIDPASITINLVASILRNDGTNIRNDSHVGPVNLLLQSLFSEIEVTMKDTKVTASNNTYSYKAYLEIFLSYEVEAKATQLTSEIYYKDTPANIGQSNPIHQTEANVNQGLKTRHLLFVAGSVEMQGRIHCDIFMQEKLIPDGVPIKIKLHRNKDAFCLISNIAAPNYKISINECKISVRKCKLSPSTFVALAKTLELGNAKYPISRSVCKSFIIPQGSLSICQENLFTGQLPSKLVLGCVSNNAFNGSYDTNPFNFENYDMKEVKILLDGQSQLVKPIILNFGQRKYLDGYLSLFQATGIRHKNEGIDLHRYEYPNGYALYAFDLTADQNDDCNLNLIKEGSLRIDLVFGTPLPNTVNVIVLATFENIIEIDRNKNVILDY